MSCHQNNPAAPGQQCLELIKSVEFTGGFGCYLDAVGQVATEKAECSALLVDCLNSLWQADTLGPRGNRLCMHMPTANVGWQ